MTRSLLICALLIATLPGSAAASAEFVATPYKEQKVVFDFYFDDPAKINTALYWLKGLVDPLIAPPYNHALDDLNIKVIIHGTELVTVAKHNYERYRDAVERMRYYADLGVEFKVCQFAAKDYDYSLDDFQDFIQVVPSAIAEMAYWQSQGYVMITPRVQEKRFSIDEIR